jgi:hypothetical protein
MYYEEATHEMEWRLMKGTLDRCTMKKLLLRWNGVMWEWRLMKGMLDRCTVKKFKGKVIEDIKVEKENDELEVILKSHEEICGKVMDFTDLAAQVRYEMEWSNVGMETD